MVTPTLVIKFNYSFAKLNSRHENSFCQGYHFVIHSVQLVFCMV